MLQNYRDKQVRRVVGLMSGTSVDGIDAAVVQLSGPPHHPRAELLFFENTPFPPEVRQEIFALFNPEYATVTRVGAMNMLLGELYARATLASVEKSGLRPGEIDCIGSHGQTIYHQPSPVHMAGESIRYTVQIGDGAVIAQRTGLPCYSDFRVADMAAGGLGAPLVPFTEYLLYSRQDESLLLQNIGGIANITVLPAGGAPADIVAFDTGPGNMVIDALAAHYTGGARQMDIGGRLAAQGTPNAGLLAHLQADAYFSLAPPKTTGREYFGLEYVQTVLAWQQQHGLSNADTIATATMLTAWSIADAARRFILRKTSAARMVVGGGGSYNPILMQYLTQQMALHRVAVDTQESLGQSSDAKEAVAFAVLADCAAMGLPNSLPSVTGAKNAAIMGKLSMPPPAP